MIHKSLYHTPCAFTPQSQAFQAVAAAHGYRSPVWVRVTKTTPLLESGAAPRTIVRTSVSRSSTAVHSSAFAPSPAMATLAAVDEPHSIDNLRRIPEPVASMLKEAASARGLPGNWWAIGSARKMPRLSQHSSAAPSSSTLGHDATSPDVEVDAPPIGRRALTVALPVSLEGDWVNLEDASPQVIARCWRRGISGNTACLFPPRFTVAFPSKSEMHRSVKNANKTSDAEAGEQKPRVTVKPFSTEQPCDAFSAPLFFTRGMLDRYSLELRPGAVEHEGRMTAAVFTLSDLSNAEEVYAACRAANPTLPANPTDVATPTHLMSGTPITVSPFDERRRAMAVGTTNLIFSHADLWKRVEVPRNTDSSVVVDAGPQPKLKAGAKVGLRAFGLPTIGAFNVDDLADPELAMTLAGTLGKAGDALPETVCMSQLYGFDGSH